MTDPIAILDTDVAVLLLDTRKVMDTPTHNRRERALQAIADVRKRGARCVVATPTLTELVSCPANAKPILAKLRRFVLGLRSMPLSVKGAEAAGEMLLTKLKPRPAGKSRTEIKFDALIAGVAHAEARWLITGNAKDYKPLLTSVQSSVQIVDIDAVPPNRGHQLSLAEQGLQKK